jgi:hypothetical protein
MTTTIDRTVLTDRRIAGIPLAWGVWITLKSAVVLFH